MLIIFDFRFQTLSNLLTGLVGRSKKEFMSLGKKRFEISTPGSHTLGVLGVLRGMLNSRPRFFFFFFFFWSKLFFNYSVDIYTEVLFP